MPAFKNYFKKAEKEFSPILEKRLRNTLVRVLEECYNKPLTEGFFSNLEGGSANFNDELDMSEDDIRDKMVDTLGKEDLVDRLMNSPEKAIDKLQKIHAEAKKNGNNAQAQIYARALKLLMMYVNSQKEGTFDSELDNFDNEYDTGDETETEAPEEAKIENAAEKADKVAAETAGKKEEAPENPKEEESIDIVLDVFDAWNKQIVTIQKRKGNKKGDSADELEAMVSKLEKINQKYGKLMPSKIEMMSKKISRTLKELGGTAAIEGKPEEKAVEPPKAETTPEPSPAEKK